MARWSEALDRDRAPVPGDADQILNLGWRLRNQSNAIATDVRELRRIAGNKAELAMYGNYAPKVSEAISEIPGQLERLGNAYWDCGQALKTYGSKLRELQNQANTVRNTAGGAGSNVESAKRRLDGIVETYKRAEESCARTIEGALSKHRIKNKDLLAKAWDKVKAVGRWLSKWENIVKVAAIVATVVGIIALIIGSGGLAAIALIAGAVVLIDALLKYKNGEGSLADVGLAALGVIPGLGALGRVAGGLGRVATAVRAARVGGGLTRAGMALGRADAAIGRGIGAAARWVGTSRVGRVIAGSRVGQGVGRAYGRAQVVGAKVDLGMSKAIPGRLGGNALASAAGRRLTPDAPDGAGAASGTRAADDAPEPQSARTRPADTPEPKPAGAKGTDRPEPQPAGARPGDAPVGGSVPSTRGSVDMPGGSVDMPGGSVPSTRGSVDIPGGSVPGQKAAPEPAASPAGTDPPSTRSVPESRPSGTKAADAPEQPATQGVAPERPPAPSKQPALPPGPDSPPALGPAQHPAAHIRSSPVSPNAPWKDLPVPPQSIADGPPPEIHVRWEPTQRGGPPRPLNAAPVEHRSPIDENVRNLLGADRASIADQANVPLIPEVKDGKVELGTVPLPTGFPNALEHTIATSVHLEGRPFGFAAEHQSVGAVLDATPALAAFGLGIKQYGPPVWRGAKALGRAFKAGYDEVKSASPDAGGFGPFATRITRAVGPDLDELSGDDSEGP